MGGPWPNGSGNSARPGSILLMLVIGIAILALLYAWQLSASFFRPIPKYSDPNAMPWEEHHLIRSEALVGYGLHQRQKRSAGQLKFARTVYFEANVGFGQENRGRMEFGIGSDGSIRGSWSAGFTTGSPQVHYTALEEIVGRYTSNTFKGNVAPSKVYEGERGPDESMLYLIARGDFLLSVRDTQDNKTDRMSGELYLTGWLNSDYFAFGKLTLVPGYLRPRKEYRPGEPLLEAETFMVFDWEALPKQSQSNEQLEKQD